MMRPVAALLLAALLVCAPPGTAATVGEVREWRVRGEVEQMLAALGDADVDTRLAARDALVELREPLGNLVLDAINAHPVARAELVRRRDRRATAPLAMALAHGDPAMRMHIVDTLGELGDPAATPALLDFVARQNAGLAPPIDRTPPYWALVRLADPRALDAFMAGLRDRDPGVRRASAWGIERIVEPRALPAALHALQDPSAGVRAAAAWIFAKRTEVAALPALRQLALDADAEAREAAVWALVRCSPEPPRDVLLRALADPAVAVRAAAASGLAEAGVRDARDELLEAAADPSAAVRDAAIVALERLGEPEGARLRALLDPRSPSPDSRPIAADARLVALLERVSRLPDERARRAAFGALARADGPQARAALLAAAAGWNPARRLAATRALFGESAGSGPGFGELPRVLASPATLVYLGTTLLALALGVALLLGVGRALSAPAARPASRAARRAAVAATSS
jgi:HEAT repeat protein